MVSSVTPGSSAANNGLRVGDEFSLVNDVDVKHRARADVEKTLKQEAAEAPAVCIVARPVADPNAKPGWI